MLRELLPGSDQGGEVWVVDGKLAKQSTKTATIYLGRFAGTSLWLKRLRRIRCFGAFRLRIWLPWRRGMRVGLPVPSAKPQQPSIAFASCLGG